MNGKYCKLIEQRNDLINFIKEKEIERIDTDLFLFNFNKLALLYEILEKIDMQLLKEEMQDDM
jgi:hypothetical protein